MPERVPTVREEAFEWSKYDAPSQGQELPPHGHSRGLTSDLKSVVWPGGAPAPSRLPATAPAVPPSTPALPLPPLLDFPPSLVPILLPSCRTSPNPTWRQTHSLSPRASPSPSRHAHRLFLACLHSLACPHLTFHLTAQPHPQLHGHIPPAPGPLHIPFLCLGHSCSMSNPPLPMSPPTQVPVPIELMEFLPGSRPPWSPSSPSYPPEHPHGDQSNLTLL